MRNKVIVVVGPTAVGKTKIAIELAKYLNVDIISGDSIAIYKGLDIGSAKPTIEEMDGVKHHVIDIKEPYEDYSVADFQKDARQIIDKNELNIICGGTGLYIQSVIFDYQFETILRRKGYKKYNSKENATSQVFVINAEESNIQYIEKDNQFLNNLFAELIENYDFDVDNAAIYYLFDRDNKSNTDILFVKDMVSVLVKLSMEG